MRRAFLLLLFLVSVLGALLFLSTDFIGCGDAYLAIRVRVCDATTRKPIPGATVTLSTELRSKFPAMIVQPPTVLSAQTDAGGKAVLKDRFGAGFDKWGTSIYVGESRIKVEAAGYPSVNALVSARRRLRFYDFLVYKQPRKVEVPVYLSHP